jgi:hypothetical protein
MRKEDAEYIAKTLEMMAEMVRSKNSVGIKFGVDHTEVKGWLDQLGNFPKGWNEQHKEGAQIPASFFKDWEDLIISAGSDMGCW